MIPFFSRPVLRYFLLWMMVGLVVFYCLVKLAQGDKSLSETSGGLLVQLLAFLPILWLLGNHFFQRLQIKYLIGSGPGELTWQDALVVFLGIYFFSYSIDGLQFLMINRVVPELATELVEGPILLHGESAAINVVNITLAVVVGPIMEELVFRGVILQRLMVKTSTVRAILFSSILFGVLHFESWLTASVFGVLMCLLFLRSCNLGIPILVHMVNNATIVLLNIWHHRQGRTWSVEEIVLQYPFYLIALISIPFLFSFAKKNWPKQDHALPYEVNMDKVS